jgi:hypothetical protein
VYISPHFGGGFFVYNFYFFTILGSLVVGFLNLYPSISEGLFSSTTLARPQNPAASPLITSEVAPLQFSSIIEGMFVYITPTTSTSVNYNGYFTTAPSTNTSGTYGKEAICIDLNGDVYPVKKPQMTSSWNYEYMRKGLFAVCITSGAYCIGYNGLSGPWSMIRFSK